MSSYADDIQLIAKQKAIKGGLGSLENRAPIPGTVTPFIDAAISIPSTGASPEDVTPEATDPDDPNTYNKGDGSGGTSGGGGGGGNTSGTQSADDILEDKAGPTIPDNPADGSTEPSSGGSLDGINGLVDCATDQCVNVRLNGQFQVPDGWDDPDAPPDKSGFKEGFYWFFAVDDMKFATLSEAYDYMLSYAQSAYNNVVETGFVRIADWNGGLEQWRLYFDYNNTFQTSGYYTAQQYICDVNTTDVCPSVPPTETEWPTSSCYSLALQDGQFKASQYDSAAPTSAKEPRSAVNLCTTGGKNVMIRAAANGGSMMYETSGGAPTGTMKVFNSDGTMRMAGDATNTNINSQLPR